MDWTGHLLRTGHLLYIEITLTEEQWKLLLSRRYACANFQKCVIDSSSCGASRLWPIISMMMTLFLVSVQVTSEICLYWRTVKSNRIIQNMMVFYSFPTMFKANIPCLYALAYVWQRYGMFPLSSTVCLYWWPCAEDVCVHKWLESRHVCTQL